MENIIGLFVTLVTSGLVFIAALVTIFGVLAFIDWLFGFLVD